VVLATKKSIVVVVLGGVNSLHRVLFASVFPIEGKNCVAVKEGLRGKIVREAG